MQGEAGPFSPPADGFGASLGEALAWLDRHINLEAIESGKAGRYADPTLDRVAALLEAMGNPEKAYPVVHITGTNGKGSTARMSDALLRATGLKPGMFTSPHLETINERMAVGGEPIADEELALQLGAMAALEVFTGVKATWFELITATAFRWFSDEAVDVGVIEVGLGGRWDATNVVESSVAVVTNVQLDHTGILGNTREAIAAEKSGIIKPASLLVLGEEEPSVAAVFLDAAAQVGASAVWRRGDDFGSEDPRLAVGGRVFDFYTPFGRYEDVFVPLFGAHQGENAACALAAVQGFLGSALDSDVVEEAFSSVRVPGRLEVLGRSPTILLDGAHNVAGAAAAGAALSEDFGAASRGPAAPPRRVVVVMGCLGGRDPGELLAAIGPEQLAHVVACTAPSPRALEGQVVAEAARSLGIPAEDAGGVLDAIERAKELVGPDDILFVTGSLYVVGEARAILGR